MKRLIVNAKSFEDLICRFNPFGFKEYDGSSMIFKDYGELYLFTLKRLHAQFPRGYIDIPLFLSMLTKVPINDCKQVARSFKTLGLVEGIMLIEYWRPNTRPEIEFAKIMKAFHTISETKFSQDYFNQAWELFKDDMEKANTSDRVEDGSIVEFADRKQKEN